LHPQQDGINPTAVRAQITRLGGRPTGSNRYFRRSLERVIRNRSTLLNRMLSYRQFVAFDFFKL
jgi:hypothetical protein